MISAILRHAASFSLLIGIDPVDWELRCISTRHIDHVVVFVLLLEPLSSVEGRRSEIELIVPIGNTIVVELHVWHLLHWGLVLVVEAAWGEVVTPRCRLPSYVLLRL